jgi:hypothetical protein
MGTEVSPDGFVFGGEFEDTDLATQRETDYIDKQNKDSTEKISKPPTKKELARLRKNLITPDKRYHYRFVAAALAMHAAALLPDNTEELADVINMAGNWIKNSDGKLGNEYFQVIDRRRSKTKIGAEASAAHWFIDDALGPWSTTEKSAYDAMHVSYGGRKTSDQ